LTGAAWKADDLCYLGLVILRAAAFSPRYTQRQDRMRWFRITLILVLLGSLAYFGYVKTRPVAGPSAAPLQKPSPSTPRNPVPPAPAIQPIAAQPTETMPTRKQDDPEKLDQEIIARAKAAKLSGLQQGMPDQQFGEWIQETFSNKATISWEVNDCGENDGSGHQEEVPICAQVNLDFPAGEHGQIWILVGSEHVRSHAPTTLDGPPGLFISLFIDQQKKLCGSTLDRLAQWANGSRQDPPCKPAR